MNELCAKHTGENRNLLERLLRTIDEVFHLRISGPVDSGHWQTIEGEYRFGRARQLLVLVPLLTYGQIRVPTAFHLSTAQRK